MITHNISATSFHTDQSGINNLKNTFFEEAREFVYFRKGEWTGIVDSVQHASNWLQSHPEFVPTVLAFYKPTAELLKSVIATTGKTEKKVMSFFSKTPPDKHYVTRRVICSVRPNTKSEIANWEKICGKGSVAIIAKSQAGHFRYLVNEKRYAIFSRLGENSLQGIMGSDKDTIIMLREIFDKEFITTSIKNSQRK